MLPITEQRNRFRKRRLNLRARRPHPSICLGIDLTVGSLVLVAKPHIFQAIDQQHILASMQRGILWDFKETTVLPFSFRQNTQIQASVILWCIGVLGEHMPEIGRATMFKFRPQCFAQYGNNIADTSINDLLRALWDTLTAEGYRVQHTRPPPVIGWDGPSLENAHIKFTISSHAPRFGAVRSRSQTNKAGTPKPLYRIATVFSGLVRTGMKSAQLGLRVASDQGVGGSNPSEGATVYPVIAKKIKRPGGEQFPAGPLYVRPMCNRPQFRRNTRRARATRPVPLGARGRARPSSGPTRR